MFTGLGEAYCENSILSRTFIIIYLSTRKCRVTTDPSEVRGVSELSHVILIPFVNLALRNAPGIGVTVLIFESCLDRGLIRIDDSFGLSHL
jgi:hypothetical protein